MEDQTPRFCAKFHESANRSHLLFGCEKELLVANLLFAVLIVYTFLPNLWGIPIAALVFFLTYLVLRRMAQHDLRFRSFLASRRGPSSL